MVLNRAVNRVWFEAFIEQVLASLLDRGDEPPRFHRRPFG